MAFALTLGLLWATAASSCGQAVESLDSGDDGAYDVDAGRDTHVGDDSRDAGAEDHTVRFPDQGDAVPPEVAPVVFSSDRYGNYDLFLLEHPGSTVEQLTTALGVDIHPAVSPDNTRIAFTSSRNGALGIYLMRLDTRAISALAVGFSIASSPAFSPDGETVSFEAREMQADQPDVYSVPVGGGEPTQLTRNPQRDACPVFAPDGTAIYFVSNRSGSYEVWRMSITGEDQQAVTTAAAILGRPAVSPDGGSLVYSRTDPTTGVSELVRFDIASSSTEVISADNDSEPAFSADGTRLVFTTLRFGNPEIVLQPIAAASAAVRLTQDPHVDGSAAFFSPVW